MLTIKMQKNADVAKKYLEEHLTADDYYSNENTSPGEWGGKLSSQIGLNTSQPVNAEDFNALIDGRNPVKGGPLTSRLNKKGRRIFFDCTFSAPKSLSILAITYRDSRLLKAHKEAVKLALEYLESITATRVRKEGADYDRKTGNMLTANFLHTTSRENDPQVHSHVILFNVTYDEIEKKFKALQARDIYDQARLITEVYRQILAKLVIEIGYDIEKAEHGFEIKGVKSELLERYSKRSKGIKRLIFEKEQEIGRRLTNNEKSNISRQSRKKKDKNGDYDQILKDQLSQCTSEEIKDINKLIQDSILNKEKPRFNENIESAVKYAVMHCFERKSVVNIQDLFEAALKYDYKSIITLDDLKNEVYNNKDLIFSEDKKQVGTKKELAQEWYIVNSINESKSTFKPLIENKLQNEELNIEQNIALNGVLSSKDKYVAIRGAAGTGKSKLINQIVQNLKDKNLTITAITPTTSARNSLIEDYKVEAHTLKKYLKKQSKCDYLILDEAGLVSNEDMFELMNITNEANVRVIFIGDVMQHHSVKAGDSLRIIEKHSDIECFKLSTIYRQSPLKEIQEARRLRKEDPLNYKIKRAEAKRISFYRKAVKSFEDPKKSVLYLDEINAIKEHSEKDKRYQAFSKDYVTNYKKDVIAIAPTWREIDDITQNIRIDLKQQKYIDQKEKTISSYASLKLTDAEKLIVNKDHKNKFIVSYDKSSGLEPNKYYQILDTKNKKYILDNGKEFEPDHNNITKFDLVQKKQLQISKGERLIIQENNKEFTNGDVVVVKDFKKDKIVLKDGREIDKNIKRFDYGYVTTSIKSQGRTHEKVIAAMSAESGRALSLNQFYVTISRGRKDISVYVDDKNLLYERLGSLAQRQSNLELKNISAQIKSYSDKPEYRDNLFKKIPQKELDRILKNRSKSKENSLHLDR